MEPSHARAFSPLVIRDLRSTSDFRQAETLQKTVWGVSDRDVVPSTQFVAARAAGGVIVGAFDEDTLAGFAYAFPSIDEHGPAMHSHLLAVAPRYRRQRVGYDLKLAQRIRTLAMGVTRMTWTFDPLRPVNARLNFSRLGVVSDQYLVDFYGTEIESDLDCAGTDRLWVTWFLDSPRVHSRLCEPNAREPERQMSSARPLVRLGPSGRPDTRGLDNLTGNGYPGAWLSVDIPATNVLSTGDAGLSRAWRSATRQALSQAFAAGYRVEEFLEAHFISDGSPHPAGATGVYLLAPPASSHANPDNMARAERPGVTAG